MDGLPRAKLKEGRREFRMDNETGSTLEARLASLEAATKRIADRNAIIDCIVRFCRAINRQDTELLLSVFHPDAIDDHGFFVGDRQQFLKWIGLVYADFEHGQHYVTNHTIELNGSEAHVESYWLVVNVLKGAPAPLIAGGRYIDRFEERDGLWAIARRVCLTEWGCAPGARERSPDVTELLAKSGISALDKTDLSYRRPLDIRREPLLVAPYRRQG